MKRVLFVCTANLQRSPTAETLFHGWKGAWEAKSAGIMPDPGCRLLTQELVDWADVIIVMEHIHQRYMQIHFPSSREKIHVLKIADSYYRDDPELKRRLLREVPSILEKYQPAEFGTSSERFSE
jgi:predicted protein tyrosine phosphatase